MTGVALFALFVLWESRELPLGTMRQPGPSFVLVLLAALLLIFAIVIAVTGGRSERFRALRWRELPHAAAILAVSAFSALALERLGYRITVLLVLLFLVKFLEKKSWLSTAVAAVTLSFGSLEKLVSLMQETPIDRLLPMLTEQLRGGTDLRRLVAAAALANARTFGGEDHVLRRCTVRHRCDAREI